MSLLFLGRRAGLSAASTASVLLSGGAPRAEHSLSLHDDDDDAGRTTAPSGGVVLRGRPRFSLPRAPASSAAWCEGAEGPTQPGHPDETQSKHLNELADVHGAERYLGYASALARLKLILLRAKTVAAEGVRYIAYSSDIGESMRPILRPWMVTASYGVAVGYVFLDTGVEVRRKHLLGLDADTLTGTALHRLVFHGAVSLALPAVIIHTAVHQTHHLLHTSPRLERMPRLVRYGPTAVGLGIIPFLPILDEPAEHLLDWSFDRFWPKWRLGEDNAHHNHHDASGDGTAKKLD